MMKFTLDQLVVENRSHLNLTVATQVRDGKLYIIIDEQEQRSACGLIIPKRGEKPLVS